MPNSGFGRKESRFQKEGPDADRIERKSGGGCLALFGTPFFLAGLFVLLTGLGFTPVPVSGGMASRAAAAVFGLVFTAVGGLLIFGRSGLIIDRTQNQVIRWYGLPVPLKRTVQSLDRFEIIRVDCSHEDKSTVYPVRLMGKDGVAAVTIEQQADVQQARRTSEELARFLNKPIEDRSTGMMVIRDPDHLNESLRNRVRRLKEDQGFFPPQPLPMRTRIEQLPDGVVLSIPGPVAGMAQSFRLVASFVFAGFAAFILLPGLRSLPAPNLVHDLIGGVILFFMVLLPILTAVISLIRSRRKVTRITATRAFLRREEKSGGRMKAVEIPSDELEELTFADRRSLSAQSGLPGREKGMVIGDTGRPRFPDGRPIPGILLSLMRLVPSQGITARSDKATLTFGGGLSDAELAYLHALIRKILTD